MSLSTKKLEPTPGDMLRDPGLVYRRADEMAAAFRSACSRHMPAPVSPLTFLHANARRQEWMCPPSSKLCMLAAELKHASPVEDVVILPSEQAGACAG